MQLCPWQKLYVLVLAVCSLVIKGLATCYRKMIDDHVKKFRCALNLVGQFKSCKTNLMILWLHKLKRYLNQ
jgi:hypothetical protein